MQKETILIIDDQKSIGLIISQYLSKNDYIIDFAFNGADAIVYLESKLPDLILMDIMMPGMSGLELSKKIKSNPNQKDIPILFLTALNEIDTLREAFESGGVDYITKPFDSEELRLRIQTHLHIRKLELERTKHIQEIELQKVELKRIYDHLQSELELARITQNSIIQVSFPQINGLKIYTEYKPIEAVGGDFFCHSLNGDELTILFGDVSGHGLSAALITGIVTFAFQTEVNKTTLPSHSLHYIYSVIASIGVRQHISAICIKYNIKNRELQYSIAGHHPFLLMRSQGIISLKGSGTYISTFQTMDLNDYTIQLKSKDKIFFFSDGIFEGLECSNRRCNWKCIRAHLEKYIYKTGNELFDFISSEMIGNQQLKDDVTMLLLEVE